MPEGNADNGLNIQQTLYNGFARSKLIEAEIKLNRVFEEYTGRIESFMLMLDTLKAGILIVSKAGEIYYANEAGNAFKTVSASHIFYRNLEEEMVIPLNDDLNQTARINNFFWNGEQCNIFVIEKNDPVKPAVVDQTTTATPEPFEQLMNYVRRIALHDATGKTSEATQYAELANKSVTENERLLNDIKAFTSLVNYTPVLSAVSMQKIAGDILKSMGPEIEEAGMEISLSELPETTADKELITKLLKQLISNAFKFRNKGRKAIIDIGHDKIEGQFIFCVRDNGIGISKKYHEEIFNPFVSLNGQADYPGNGMGLAICKKIVELHSGKIWVESLPGHGSNFYFKLNTK